MPIIINELEVIAPPPAPEKIAQTAEQAHPQLGPRPTDIHRVTRKFMQRRYRLQAR